MIWLDRYNKRWVYRKSTVVLYSFPSYIYITFIRTISVGCEKSVFSEKYWINGNIIDLPSSAIEVSLKLKKKMIT